MCIQALNLKSLMTRPGFLRIGFSVISLIAVGLIGAAVNKSLWKKSRNGYTCPFSSCPSDWLVETSLAIIIFSWLFSLGILVAMVSQIHKKWTKIFSVANEFGYPMFGVFLTGSFIFILAYLIQIAVFDPCKFYAYNCNVKGIKSRTFQPGLFASGAVITLAAGILGVYIFKDTKNYKRSTQTTTPSV